MRRRIYWLLPDLASAREAMDSLLLARIDMRNMHFVAREDSDLAGLHAANLLQTSDIVRSAEMGLVIGASVGGLVGALVAVDYPMVGDDPQWELALALAIFGAVFGAWASSMIGVSTPSEHLKRFEHQIEEGQILLIVDVPMRRMEQIKARLRALRPDARVERSVPQAPGFP